MLTVVTHVLRCVCVCVLFEFEFEFEFEFVDINHCDP